MASQERIKYYKPRESSQEYDYSKEQAADHMSRDTTAQNKAHKAGKIAVKDEITDDLLDEIDSVLEENAQEFVERFQQRGGQ